MADCNPPPLLWKEYAPEPAKDVYYWQDPACGKFFLESSPNNGETWEVVQPTITSRGVTKREDGTYLIGPKYKSVVVEFPEGTLLRMFQSLV